MDRSHKFTVKSNRRRDFLNLVKENQKKTLELEVDRDALQYTVGEDIHHPNTFYIHEQFQNGVHGFNAHRDTDHAKDWAFFKNSNPFEEGNRSLGSDDS